LRFSDASEVTLLPAEGVAEADALEAFDAEGADTFRVFSTVETEAPDAEGAAEALALILVEMFGGAEVTTTEGITLAFVDVVGGADVTTTEGFVLALVVVTGGKDAATEVATEVAMRALVLVDSDVAAVVVAVAGNVLNALVTTADALVIVGTPEGPLNKPVGAGTDVSSVDAFARSPSEAVSRPSEVSMS